MEALFEKQVIATTYCPIHVIIYCFSSFLVLKRRICMKRVLQIMVDHYSKTWTPPQELRHESATALKINFGEALWSFSTCLLHNLRRVLLIRHSCDNTHPILICCNPQMQKVMFSLQLLWLFSGVFLLVASEIDKVSHICLSPHRCPMCYLCFQTPTALISLMCLVCS